MHVSYPIWLRRASNPGAMVFAILFTFESLARASLATVIPLSAHEMLGNARDVAILYTAVGLTGLAGSFSIPFLIRHFRRRWVYTGGAIGMIVAAGLIALHTLPTQAVGMVLRSFAIAAMNISMSLYIMDYIRRRDLTKVEPFRLMMSSGAWTLGPWLGVYLNARFGHGTAEAMSAVSIVCLIVYFWYLRMQDNPAVAAATRPPPSPFAAIRRFVSQPRLRLAWIIPFARSTWWAMFFVYPPIYAKSSGLGAEMGALLVSAGNALLIFSPLVGRLAYRIGMRRPIIFALAGSGICTLLAVVLYDFPWAVAAVLLAGATGTVILDALGNIPFMRSVRPWERPQMTTVFRTYIDCSELLPSILFSALLTWYDLRAVFVVSGLWLIVVAFVALKLPKRM
ncbi:MAG: MFS transporter [Dongiaceae bacterium]